MIPIDKLKSVKTLVIHTNSDGACADGLAAELILRDALPDVEVVLAQYGTAAYKNLEPRTGVLFCDIVPYVERDKSGAMTEAGFATANAWVDAGAIVLDHHKGSADLVEMFGENGVFADEKMSPGVSGALLAYYEWYRVFGNVPINPSVSDFAFLAGVYDTWQKHDPAWVEARSQAFALRFWPRRRLVEAGLGKKLFDMLRIGEVLVEKHDAEVQRVVGGAFRCKVGDVRVAMFQATSKEVTNDVPDALGDTADVAVGFELEADECGIPFVKYSCRSHVQPDGRVFDCNAFAKANGGGGHTQAAGFALKNAFNAARLSPYLQFADALRAFLNK